MSKSSMLNNFDKMHWNNIPSDKHIKTTADQRIFKMLTECK